MGETGHFGENEVVIFLVDPEPNNFLGLVSKNSCLFSQVNFDGGSSLSL